MLVSIPDVSHCTLSLCLCAHSTHRLELRINTRGGFVLETNPNLKPWRHSSMLFEGYYKSDFLRERTLCGKERDSAQVKFHYVFV